MKTYKTDLLDLRCCDCMELMAEYPDNYFNLAIVDPPYGIGEDGERSNRPRKTNKWRNPIPKDYIIKKWDSLPDKSYFLELKRVSKNQIIWGANYMHSVLTVDNHSWIVWDKKNGENDFADCELAWTSFDKAVRKFEYLWNGFQKQRPERRFHPTQKPRALYDFILHNYAKPGDRILDTHLGSASIAIACHYKGFHLTGAELDESYFDAAIARVKRETAQQELAL